MRLLSGLDMVASISKNPFWNMKHATRSEKSGIFDNSNKKCSGLSRTPSGWSSSVERIANSSSSVARNSKIFCNVSKSIMDVSRLYTADSTSCASKCRLDINMPTIWDRLLSRTATKSISSVHYSLGSSIH